MKDMHMTRLEAQQILISVITLPLMYANGWAWKEFFVQGIAEHADKIDGWTALCFYACSGCGVQILIVSAGITLKVSRYMDKRRGSEEEGEDIE